MDMEALMAQRTGEWEEKREEAESSPGMAEKSSSEPGGTTVGHEARIQEAWHPAEPWGEEGGQKGDYEGACGGLSRSQEA